MQARLSSELTRKSGDLAADFITPEERRLDELIEINTCALSIVKHRVVHSKIATLTFPFFLLLAALEARVLLARLAFEAGEGFRASDIIA